MRVLVTGATGKIGSCLVTKLIAAGVEVRGLVKSGEKAKFLPNGAEPIIGDITDIDSLKRAVQGVDVVYHLAALVFGYTTAGKDDLYRVNVTGTESLLKACCEARIKHFVYASSIAVYGDKLNEIPARETTECRPTSDYGKTKLLGEQLVGRYAHDFTASSLRISIVYGSGFEDAYFPILDLLERGKLKVLGDGQNRLPFVHVNDVADALILSASNAHGNRIYNISESDSLTQKEIFIIAAKELGVPEPSETVSPFLAKLALRINNFFIRLKGKKPKVFPEYIDQLTCNRSFDISKARRELGYEPKVHIKDGIKEVVSYYKSNRTDKKNKGLLPEQNR